MIHWIISLIENARRLQAMEAGSYRGKFETKI